MYGAGAYLIEDYWGRNAGRSPPLMGHLTRPPELKEYLKTKKNVYLLLYYNMKIDKWKTWLQVIAEI